VKLPPKTRQLAALLPLKSQPREIQNVIFTPESSYAFSQTALEKVALLGSWFRAPSEKISSES
jgi:hypothetical protein